MRRSRILLIGVLTLALVAGLVLAGARARDRAAGPPLERALATVPKSSLRVRSPTGRRSAPGCATIRRAMLPVSPLPDGRDTSKSRSDQRWEAAIDDRSGMVGI